MKNLNCNLILENWRYYNMRRKKLTSVAYMDGKVFIKDVVQMALDQNKMLSDLKEELKEQYPEIEFKVERV